MKKIKKIASIILGLLSSLNFKSAAMGKNIYDENYDIMFEEDDDNPRKDFCTKELCELGTVCLFVIPILLSSYLIYEKLTSGIRLDKFIIDSIGNNCLKEFNGNEEIKRVKTDLEQRNTNFFLKKCNDEIIKYLCSYYVLMLVTMELYTNYNSDLELKLVLPKGYDSLSIFLSDLVSLYKPDNITAQVIKYCNCLQNKEAGDVQDYLPSFCIALIRSLFDLKYLKIENEKVQVENPDLDIIVHEGLSKINSFLSTHEITINDKSADLKIRSKRLKKFHSWMAYCLGLNLWKELYPNKEYDEEEYLRLQKQLCII